MEGLGSNGPVICPQGEAVQVVQSLLRRHVYAEGQGRGSLFLYALNRPCPLAPQKLYIEA